MPDFSDCPICEMTYERDKLKPYQVSTNWFMLCPDCIEFFDTRQTEMFEYEYMEGL